MKPFSEIREARQCNMIGIVASAIKQNFCDQGGLLAIVEVCLSNPRCEAHVPTLTEMRKFSGQRHLVIFVGAAVVFVSQ